MSSFAERVKLLLQKRLDSPKWPVGDSPPGGIRYLSDGQGNMIALLTTSVNPNDAEPIGPGSAESAAEADPIIKAFGTLDLPYTAVLRTSLKIITLVYQLTGTEEIMTLEAPSGTDYSVPAGKVFLGLRLVIMAGVANIGVGIGYGDDGVAAGNTEPTTPVNLTGEFATGATQKGPYTAPTADTTEEFDIYVEVPTGKFPYAHAVATSGDKDGILYGAEVDA